MPTVALVKVPAIDCNLGVAKVGDFITIPTPLLFGPDAKGKLIKIEGAPGSWRHVYDVSLFGVWIGQVEMMETKDQPIWGVVV